MMLLQCSFIFSLFYTLFIYSYKLTILYTHCIHSCTSPDEKLLYFALTPCLKWMGPSQSGFIIYRNSLLTFNAFKEKFIAWFKLGFSKTDFAESLSYLNDYCKKRFSGPMLLSFIFMQQSHWFVHWVEVRVLDWVGCYSRIMRAEHNSKISIVKFISRHILHKLTIVIL